MTNTQSSNEVLVTGLGDVFTAPVGTAFPALTVDLVEAAGWTQLGFVEPAGAKFDFGRNVNEIFAWQRYEPVRTVIKTIPKKVIFNLMQWNIWTAELALGGGTVTEPTPGNFDYDPPDESFVDERALIVTGTDGDRHYRMCFRKALNEAGVSFSFMRENPATLPITMSILAADAGAKAYKIQTDDPSFAGLTEPS